MAKKTKATSAEEKLRALYDLQLIDSRIDRLRVVRGELPLEVEDLEDELAGLSSRLERLTEESDGIKQKIQEDEGIKAERLTLIWERRCLMNGDMVSDFYPRHWSQASYPGGRIPDPTVSCVVGQGDLAIQVN